MTSWSPTGAPSRAPGLHTLWRPTGTPSSASAARTEQPIPRSIRSLRAPVRILASPSNPARWTRNPAPAGSSGPPNSDGVLLTTLVDSQAYPAQTRADLYHPRGSIEDRTRTVRQTRVREAFPGSPGPEPARRAAGTHRRNDAHRPRTAHDQRRRDSDQRTGPPDQARRAPGQPEDRPLCCRQRFRRDEAPLHQELCPLRAHRSPLS